MSKAITDAEFETEVLKSPVPVVVDFWAPWCGPCKAMNPILEQLSAEMEGKVQFVKINVDEQNEVAGKFGVMSIPTFMVFKGGDVVKTMVGSTSREEFRRAVESAVA